MELDPTNQFIKTITNLSDINDKTILEIGCGKGRITRDLVKYAKLVIAIDLNSKLLKIARKEIRNKKVNFLLSKGEELFKVPGKFDLIIYSLSLHHIPEKYMLDSLKQATKKLNEKGKIIVIEPGKAGSFINLEKSFLIGDGNEEEEKKKAKSSILKLTGWKIKKEKNFQTKFYFNSLNDLIKNIGPKNWKGNEEKLRRYLKQYTSKYKIELFAERKIYLIEKI
jgi:ubiquinone/menaquinone biosynthesis C-methylase UbiE